MMEQTDIREGLRAVRGRGGHREDRDNVLPVRTSQQRNEGKSCTKYKMGGFGKPMKR